MDKENMLARPPVALAFFILVCTFGAFLNRDAQAYELRAAREATYNAASPVVDVNLGESPEELAAACWMQLTGKELSEEEVRSWAAKLGTPETPRRIDLVLNMAEAAGVEPRLEYSDPWKDHLPLEPAPPAAIPRKVGAVFMYFFNCPNDPNGSVHWTNNHVLGMAEPHPFYASLDGRPGYYNPRNSGFWYRELQDAAHAGLSFLLLGCYGPDLNRAQVEPMKAALEHLGTAFPVKIGLFDDTWTWGKPFFGDFWKQIPDLSDPDTAAKTLYEAKWKPFFQAVPREHWFVLSGRPVIYFYNGGTLVPRSEISPVLERMKSMFLADFGVEPFLVVDTAFRSDKGLREVADSTFQWFTLRLPDRVWRDKAGEMTLSHAMPRWDSISRDNGDKERAARPEDLPKLIKDDALMRQILDSTRDDNLLVIATWNDLGEGTSMNRCYDYYWDGAWKRPDHFMDLIRRSQAGETLTTNANIAPKP